jgi:polysaccharide export outer membrane protein
MTLSHRGEGLLRIAIAVLVVSALSLSCRSWANGYNHYAKEPDPRTQEYVIGVADHLTINVWRDGELSTEAQVRPDGTITMPLIGDLVAAGRTPTQLKREIKSRLETYVKNSIVTVAVMEVNSYRFTVTGEVGAPGVFATKSFVTVSEAIAQAGGPTRYADDDDVILIRKDPNGKIRRIPIDYEGIVDGDATQQDIVVLSGDTLFVP